MKQHISISLTSDSGSNSFDILHIYISLDNTLTVVSELSHALIGDAEEAFMEAKVDVEVQEIMPVKHYIIGLHESYSEERLPEVPFTMIDDENEISSEEKAECIYSKPKPIADHQNNATARLTLEEIVLCLKGGINAPELINPNPANTDRFRLFAAQRKAELAANNMTPNSPGQH